MADGIAERRRPRVRPTDHHAGGLKPLSRKRKVNEELSAVLMKNLRLDAQQASESTGVLHVERRERLGRDPPNDLRRGAAKGVNKSIEVVHLGRRTEENEKLPLRLKGSLSDEEETPQKQHD